MPKGTVTFTRKSIDHLPNWDNDDTKLTALHVSSEGTIEDDGLGLLQVNIVYSKCSKISIFILVLFKNAERCDSAGRALDW